MSQLHFYQPFFTAVFSNFLLYLIFPLEMANRSDSEDDRNSRERDDKGVTRGNAEIPSLFIRNINYKITPEELREYFEVVCICLFFVYGIEFTVTAAKDYILI